MRLLRRALGQQLVPPVARGWLAAALASTAAAIGDPEHLRYLSEAERAVEQAPGVEAQAQLRLARAAQAMASADLPRAADELAAVDVADPALRTVAPVVRGARIGAQLGMGRYDDAGATIRVVSTDVESLGGWIVPRAAAVDCVRLLCIGALPEALARARLAQRVTVEARSDDTQAALLGVMVEVAYRAGRPEQARALLDEHYRDRAWPDDMPWLALAWSAAGDPEPARVVTLLRVATRELSRSLWQLQRIPQQGPRLIRSWLSVGDRHRAGQIATALRTVATRTPIPLWHGVAEHAAGLVEGRVEALRSAVATLRGTGARVELADALLDVSRRSPRGSDALRTSGQEAAALFGRIGATGDQAVAEQWVRCAATVSASGMVTMRPEHGIGALTMSERRVAELLATGVTKREAAAALFVSFHTVDSHLRAIYAKLGVSNRVEFARRWDEIRWRPALADPEAGIQQPPTMLTVAGLAAHAETVGCQRRSAGSGRPYLSQARTA
jgi:DNA-binding CsgD family transcriptional regulator